MDLPRWISYALLTYFISAIFYYQIAIRGGVGDSGFRRRFRLVLWIPGLVALGFRITAAGDFPEVGNSLDNWPVFILALLLPVAIEALVILVSILLKWGAVPPDILSLDGRTVMIGENFGLLMKEDRQSFPRFALNLVASILIGILISGIFAFGQEFGWRGYLQWETVRSFGLTGGILLVGLIWGLWYSPLVLMGYEFPHNRLLGALLLMPLTAIFLSFVTSWLYLRSGNIWTPTILHAGILASSDLSKVGLGEGGNQLRVRLVWMTLWLLAAIILWSN